MSTANRTANHVSLAISLTANPVKARVTDGADDFKPSLNATAVSGLVSTFNTTSGNIASSLNHFLLSTAIAEDFVNSTNMMSSPSPLATSVMSLINKSTSTSAQELSPEMKAAKMINFWVPPFLFFIGILANILVIMVMQSKDFRHMSISFYMSISSIVDMASLLVSLPAHYLYVNFPQIFDNVRDAHPMCSFFNLFGWGSSDMGVLLTVAMTTDRSLAIQFPLKASTLCTVRRAKIVTFGLFLLVLLKVGHLLFTSRVVKKEVTSHLCDVDKNSDKNYAIFYTYYWPYLHNVFLLVAFIVIVIGNIIITVHVRRSEGNKDIREGAKTAGGARNGKMVSKSRQLSMMLIIDSATIVICTLPFSIYVVVDQTFELFDDTPNGQGESSLVYSVVFYLLYVNRCANFFLYCVSGARFRQVLLDIVTRKSQKRNNCLSCAINPRNVPVSTISSDLEMDRVSMNPSGPPLLGAELNGKSFKISADTVEPSTQNTEMNGKSSNTVKNTLLLSSQGTRLDGETSIFVKPSSSGTALNGIPQNSIGMSSARTDPEQSQPSQISSNPS